MRVGVRLQIVLALSALLGLAFIPLFAAVTSLTGATLRGMRASAARSVGEIVARHVVAHAPLDPIAPAAWNSVLAAEVFPPAVLAVAVYDDRGRCLGRAGDASMLSALRSQPLAAGEQVAAISSDDSTFRVVVGPIDRRLVVGTVVRAPDDRDRAAPLVRLVALYTGMVALALLVFAYIALTHIIVRPLESLSKAARRVAAGARTFEAPTSGTAVELSDLAASVSEMTATLRADEERMRAQIEQLEQRARELREAQDRLVRSERLASVGRLSAGLAHEIGNPIAAMMGLEDLLLEGGLDSADQRDFLRRIRTETERIHRVLRDLLDFARPAAQRIAAQGPPAHGPAAQGPAAQGLAVKRANTGGGGGPGDVAAAIEDVLALVRPQRSFREVRVESRIADDLVPVTLEHERIVQVVLNLMMNAADAIAPSGAIRITAEHAEPAASGVVIAIEDDGPGVTPSIVPRLFEPFVSTKEVGQGTGLGLAVCRGLVEGAGGRIRLDETYGPPGARFVVELPAAVSAAAASPPTTSQPV